MTSDIVTGARLSKTSPSFLHANSTSHTWLFSAFAELIDNAYDPDVRASELRIEVKQVAGQQCLELTDNGNGMDENTLHKMLSFGYCEKEGIKASYKAVGQYGNGFKSGSMRLGKDAVVFTRGRNTCSVGFLSQTFLEKIKADAVLVPIVSFDRNTLQLITTPDSGANLTSITDYSLFPTANSLRR